MSETYKPVSVEDETWRLQGACRDHPNPRIFLYAKPGRPTDDDKIEPFQAPQDRAKAICRECPVKTECLRSSEKEVGVRGEMSYNERREFFKQQRRRKAVA